MVKYRDLIDAEVVINFNYKMLTCLIMVAICIYVYVTKMAVLLVLQHHIVTYTLR